LNVLLPTRLGSVGRARVGIDPMFGIIVDAEIHTSASGVLLIELYAGG
jgi:hypothetical protein